MTPESRGAGRDRPDAAGVSRWLGRFWSVRNGSPRTLARSIRSTSCSSREEMDYNTAYGFLKDRPGVLEASGEVRRHVEALHGELDDGKSVETFHSHHVDISKRDRPVTFGPGIDRCPARDRRQEDLHVA